MLVVALLLTAVSTGVLAREFCAADIGREDDLDRKPFEGAMTGLYAGTPRDAAMAQLIERIRKVARI